MTTQIEEQARAVVTPIGMQRIEQRLQAERDQILIELAAESSKPDELIDEWQDRGSSAEDEMREVEFEHRGMLRERLLQINAAFKSFKNGTYGRCFDCGAPVGNKRLAVDPAASRCIACQRAIEAPLRKAAIWF